SLSFVFRLRFHLEPVPYLGCLPQ
ncbi:hypothetical protein THAOC_37035, partial [Thalassiosira oceanica]